MEVTVCVTLTIDPDHDGIGGKEQLRQSAREAIENAVQRGVANGFEHRFSTTTSITVHQVELD